MNNCPKCKKETKSKFCSSSCSASYNNSFRKHSIFTKQKIKNSVKVAIKEGRLNPPTCDSTGMSWKKIPDSNWIEYKQSCSFYTPYYLLKYIEGHKLVEENGWYHPKKNLQGASRDHMFSVKEGWNMKISPNIIRHPANCKIMLIKDNKKKSIKCSISFNELIERIKKWEMERPTGIEPAYSNYIVNDRLEGGDDTDA